MRAKLLSIASVALTSFGLSHPAEAAIQDFRVHNRASLPIVSLQVSPKGDPDWRNNVLRRFLSEEDSTYIEFPNGTRICDFDIKATFSNGYYLSYYNVNLCAISDVYFP